MKDLMGTLLYVEMSVLCEERACELNQGQGDLKGQNLSGGGQTIERSR